MSARLHAPSPTGSPSRRSAPAMSHRPFKKRDWDAELARLGVPSDSPMRLIQRNGNAVGDEANNDIVAASEEDGAAAGTDALQHDAQILLLAAELRRQKLQVVGAACKDANTRPPPPRRVEAVLLRDPHEWPRARRGRLRWLRPL